jgi:hypothetical protein
MTRIRAAALAAALALTPLAAGAEVLGWGRLFSNDALGDGHDRWRTGSYTVSRVTGPSWSGSLPEAFGTVVETRLRADILAPADTLTPDPGDRRYAGALSFGLHSHFRRGAVEFAAGLDLVATGPQTGIGRWHRRVHEALGLDGPGDAVLSAQIGDGIHPTLFLSAAQPVAVAPQLVLRPFAEVQAGAETLARIGADLLVGGFGAGRIVLRDTATGQLYPAAGAAAAGLSGVLGADVAAVADSRLLPGGDGPEPAATRTRLRAGLQWQGDRLGLFYGLAWLSPEFAGQPGGQAVGSLRIDLSF